MISYCLYCKYFGCKKYLSIFYRIMICINFKLIVIKKECIHYMKVLKHFLKNRLTAFFSASNTILKEAILCIIYFLLFKKSSIDLYLLMPFNTLILLKLSAINRFRYILIIVLYVSVKLTIKNQRYCDNGIFVFLIKFLFIQSLSQWVQYAGIIPLHNCLHCRPMCTILV